MMSVVLYGIIMGHIYSYRERYTQIGITFAVTYMLKRLVRQTGNMDHADLVGLGGYALTVDGFIKLLGDMKRNGFTGNAKEPTKSIGGLVGDRLLKDNNNVQYIIDQFQHLFGK